MTTLSLVSDTDSLDQYLNFVYGDTEGVVYSALKETDKWSQQFFNWPTEAPALKAYIRNHSTAGDVYIAPALFARPDAHKEAVSGSNVLWVEFDGSVPNLTTLQEQGIPEPSMRIRSSTEDHEHWYWRLDGFTAPSEVEKINRALTYTLGADASGWDANQILRPPLTINHKQGHSVVILAHSESVFPVGSFTRFAAPPRITDELTTQAIPDVTDLLMKFAWPVDAAKLMRTTTVETGDRSAALMKLGYYCAEMGMSNVEIFSVIRNADDRWGKFKGRQDRDRRLIDLISKARIKFPDLTDDLPVVGFADILASENVIEWVIPGLLQKSGYMLLVGHAGAGKTQVSLRFAINLALGEDYLGYEITRPHKIMFFSLEMGEADLKYFLSTMQPSLTDAQIATLQKNLLFVPLGEPLYLDSLKVQKQVEKVIADNEVEGVFYDSLGSMSDEELSSETVVKKLMGWNDRTRNTLGVFTWFIHHQRKANGANRRPNQLADVFGSHYITARATSVYCLWAGEGPQAPIEVSCLKKRLAPIELPWQIERRGNLDFQKLSTEPEVDSFVLGFEEREVVTMPVPTDLGKPAFKRDPGKDGMGFF